MNTVCLRVTRGRRETDLRSLVIDLTTNHGDPSIASLPNILLQGFFDEVPIDADTPSQVESVWREGGRGGVDSIHKGSIWSTTEAF